MTSISNEPAVRCNLAEDQKQNNRPAKGGCSEKIQTRFADYWGSELIGNSLGAASARSRPAPFTPCSGCSGAIVGA